MFFWPDFKKSFYEMAGDVSDSKTKCFVSNAYAFHADDSTVSANYMRCADLAIWAQANDPTQPHPDGLFMPIVYLYRHAIELALKSLIRAMVNAGALAEMPDKEMSEHKLIPLWRVVRPVLISTWPKADRSPVNNVQALLEDLQRFDRTGQNLRYAHEKNGNRTSGKYPQIVRLELLQEAMQEIYTFISGCESAYNGFCKS